MHDNETTESEPTITTPTFCRQCLPRCGLLVETRGDVIVSVRGDRDNPVSRGYSCPKGRAYPATHQGEGRIREPHRRTRDGGFETISIDRALDDIAERLASIVAEHGPRSIALFRGTQSYYSTLTRPVATSWMRAIDSPKVFSPSTIDQSAKDIAMKRMGRFGTSFQSLVDSDVFLLLGSNPLVSHTAMPGTFPVCDPVSSLRDAARRGLKLIVVDPRRTETARAAHLHLQPIPGEDAVLLAGFLHIILSEGLEDREFCDRFVNGVGELQRAVNFATPTVVAGRTGLQADEIVYAARLFAKGPRGAASTGTGTDMSPSSNLAEHLVACLNAVCGRFLRAGEPVPNPGTLGRMPHYEHVVQLGREWESGFQSRIGGYGLINGELPSAILADEILTPGPDQVRAMIVVGGNPASCLPDQQRAVEALSALELLVTIDPRWTETVQLSDYVIGPVLPLERSDHTLVHEWAFPTSFGQYTSPILPRPPDTMEEWEFFWGLAQRLGLTLRIQTDQRFGMGGDGAIELGPEAATPVAEELLELLVAGGRVLLDDVKLLPHGAVFPTDDVVLPGLEAMADNRLNMIPPDVAAELALVTRPPAGRSERTHLLVNRRMREIHNSHGRDVPELRRTPYNAAHFHPGDLVPLGLSEGQVVHLQSDHGAVEVVVGVDETVRSGVISMSHMWGGLPGSQHGARERGSNPQRLVSTCQDVEPINRMPRMSGIPVSIVI